MTRKLIALASSLGLLLAACSRPGEASGPAVPPAPRASRSGPDPGCSQGPGRSMIGSLCGKASGETGYAYGADKGVMGAAPTIDDSPAYATAGFKKPFMAEPGCVQRSVRISSDLLEHLTGPVTVKFAVHLDGNPGRFEVLSATSDQRIADAIWQGVKSCKWQAGTDVQGRPANIWVIMPFRFKLN